MSDQHEEIHSMAAARAKWGAKLDTKNAARRSREKAMAKTVDRRKSNATGRTEIFSFRASEELKAAVKNFCDPPGKKHKKRAMAAWLEETIWTALEAEQKKQEKEDADA